MTLRIDAHHHLWDPAARAYPWMAAGRLAPLRRCYNLDDLRRMTAAASVDATILVQAVGTLEESHRLLADAAASGGLVRGVVGWVDLAAGDINSQVAALRSDPGGHLLVGLRHQVEDELDPGWLLGRTVAAGLDACGRAGLVYDLLVRPHQLDAAAECVVRHPGVTFVLDHGGKPPLACGDLRVWEASIRRLAMHDNLFCKLSGLVTEADWEAWRGQDIVGCGQLLLDAFGPHRTMAGSDWPVCELAAGYERVWELVHRTVVDLDATERDAVLGGTCARAYGLADVAY